MKPTEDEVIKRIAKTTRDGSLNRFEARKVLVGIARDLIDQLDELDEDESEGVDSLVVSDLATLLEAANNEIESLAKLASMKLMTDGGSKPVEAKDVLAKLFEGDEDEGFKPFNKFEMKQGEEYRLALAGERPDDKLWALKFLGVCRTPSDAWGECWDWWQFEGTESKDFMVINPAHVVYIRKAQTD